MPDPIGPFQTEREAREHPAARAVYDAFGRDPGPGKMAPLNHRILCEALADVEIGAYDHRVLLWLAGWEPQTIVAIAGMITRAHEAGSRTTNSEEGR